MSAQTRPFLSPVYVVYKVDNYPGEHRAGPYWDVRLDQELFDIIGYAGVHFLRYEAATWEVPGGAAQDR